MRKHLMGALARPITAVVLAAASAAVFASNDNPATGNNGAMTFANAKVVNAPAANGATLGAGTAGMRAAKDPDSGVLRAPTASEVAEMDAQAKAKASKAAKATPATIRKTSNGLAATAVGDEFMSFEVVHKDANGKLVDQCVTGGAAAEHALNTTPATQEVQHDR